MTHKWETTDRTGWTPKGAPVTVWRCSVCRALHGGRPHRGRCGEGCGNWYPEHGRVPACDPERAA